MSDLQRVGQRTGSTKRRKACAVVVAFALVAAAIVASVLAVRKANKALDDALEDSKKWAVHHKELRAILRNIQEDAVEYGD